MSADTPSYTSSVPRFLSRVEKEEQTEPQELSRDKHQLEITRQHNRESLVQRILHVPHDTIEERRALGIPEKSPPDAVKIQTPMSRRPFTQGALKPTDTLKQSRSTKLAYFEDHRYQRNSKLQENEFHSPQRDSRVGDFRENNHDRPSKRPRRDSPVVEGSTRGKAIDIDKDGDNNSQLRRFNVPTTIEVDDGSPRNKILREVPVRNATNGHAPARQYRSPGWFSAGHSRSRSGQDHEHTSRTLNSPDELFDEAAVETSNEKALKLVADKTADRHFDAVGDRPLQHFNDISPDHLYKKSRKPLATAAKSALDSDTNSRMSRRLQVGEESPDALQGGCTTEASGTLPRKRSRTEKQSKTSVWSNREDLEPKQATESIAEHQLYSIPLRHYTLSGIPSDQNMAVTVSSSSRRLDFKLLDPLINNEPLFTMPITAILRIKSSASDEESRACLVTNLSPNFRTVCLDFASHKGLLQFQKLAVLADEHIKLVETSGDWLDRAFLQASKVAEESEQLKVHKAHSSRSSRISSDLDSLKADHYISNRSPGTKKKHGEDPTPVTNGVTIISGADRSGKEPKPRQMLTNHVTPKVQKVPGSSDRLPARGQRSSARTTKFHVSKADDLYDSIHPTSTTKASIFDSLERWKKPLVYPPTGKKRETVHFDDLQRLDDEEFLNDNLVSLFIRYLEEHADRDQMKKLHFFNSFLFEALTRDVKSRRGINYEAVQRWTAKVDLFNRDFVVVPVNEHLHWFVMIICNLSYFKRKHGNIIEDSENDGDIGQATKSPSERASENVQGSNQEEMNEASTRNSFADLTIDDQPMPISIPTSGKSGPWNQGRKKALRALPKYDIDKPIIITLDSLDQSRSTIASVLRRYIVAEARDKKGWIIDGDEIKGMTAKGIPHQDNSSDCGLYLCMYLEQFILDPYVFVHRILQRADGAGWPEQIESSNLRTALREMLLELHREQYSNRKAKIPPLGSILIRMGLPNVDAVAPGSDIANLALHPQKLDGESARLERFGPTMVSSKELKGAENVATGFVDDWKNIINSPTAINADSHRQVEPSSTTSKRSGLTSRYFTTSNGQDQAEAVVLSTPKQRRADHSTPHTILDRQDSPPEPGSNERGSDLRPRSASTDYLTSGKGYATDEDSMMTIKAPLQMSESAHTPRKRNSKSHQKHRHHGRDDMLAKVGTEAREVRRFIDQDEPVVSPPVSPLARGRTRRPVVTYKRKRNILEDGEETIVVSRSPRNADMDNDAEMLLSP